MNPERRQRIKTPYDLELHGTILPVQATARQQGDRYVGAARVRPSALGMPLVSRWGGLLWVKDEIAVEFDVVLATDLTPGTQRSTL